MIFVSVGTHDQSFDRLVKAADALTQTLKEEVTIQRGVSSYEPKNCKSISFLKSNEFEAMCRQARVVVVHGGAGSIMTSLLLGKPTVVVPRLKRYGEHNDDHQLQLTKELEREGKITAVYDIEKLPEAVRNSKAAIKQEDGIKIEKLIKEFIASVKQ